MKNEIINACVINVFAGHLILCPKFGLSHAYVFPKLNHKTQNKDTQDKSPEKHYGKMWHSHKFKK